MITEQIARLAMEKAGIMTVTNVCLGLGYTGVQLSGGETGSCFTFRSDLGPKCGVMEKAGDLIGLPAKEAIGMAMSVNLAEASVGVASINAVLNSDYRESVNAIDVIDIRKGDRVGMIGYFHPVVKSFEDVAETIRIFERNITDERLLPDWAEDIYLPDCDVVVITGVTFINKTIDHILGLCQNAREIVIMGASTCMAPEILRPYGVTLLAGSRVRDSDRLFRIVSQGGGGQDVQDCMEKLCVRLAGRR